VLALLGGARPSVTLADGPSQVEALIRQGIELRQAGQDVRAFPLFQKAYASERVPRTAGQLGLCELALGYWVEAEEHLGEALASSGNAWVDRNRDTLEQSLARAKDNVGSVSVVGGPAGAKVYLDTREVGALPLDHPLRLNKGPHDIEVRAPAGVTRSNTIVVQGGDQQTVTLMLEAKPAADVAKTQVRPLTEDGSLRRTLAWIAGGAAVAAAVVGVVGTAIWIDNLNKFDDHVGAPVGSSPPPRDCGAGDPNYGGTGCRAIHESLTTARLTAIAGYGTAAALAAGSIVLFASSSSSELKTSAAFACAPDVFGKGLSCRMSF